MTYEQGKRDHQAWATSPQFAQFDRGTAPRDIMRLFLPPVPEDLMQLQRPLPGPWAEWLRGFMDAIRDRLSDEQAPDVPPAT